MLIVDRGVPQGVAEHAADGISGAREHEAGKSQGKGRHNSE
jgi:hypothetical protein